MNLTSRCCGSLLVLLSLGACHPAPPTTDGGTGGGTGGGPGNCGGGYLNSTAANACPLACSSAVTSIADEGALHINFCTPNSYLHNPPASGNHWPAPAPWGVHPEVVRREWWVHNLEHGGIVLLYNCPGDGGTGATGVECDGGTTPPSPDGCPAEVAQLAQLSAQHAPDVWPGGLVETRILVTGDPELPGRFAAVAWDWAMVEATTLDLAATQCFIDARYGRGPEDAP